ncbi:hypothetical protein [Tropicimonas sediminicola]|uniref:Uncharacterized protein n=1 Tax=Tropicimonas sediminicola TaxID=1031541 RepID=A0A239KE55_9RHOB|nr:hypothetical protein [Tropicimonas sediminicola]SNT16637.1 hypothetical protein SAMN05421757_10764 [Tropicimonas sediminicola]
MRQPHLLSVASLLLVLSLPVTARADDVLDAIDAARAAYEAGNIQDTIDELGNAQQLVATMKAAGLLGFLPEAPDGWTREVRTDMGTALSLSLFGGGVGAAASYARGDDTFTVTLMADNAMVEAFADLLGNLGALASGSQVTVGGEAFLDQGGELTGLIEKRILVQASGAPVEVMTPLLETIDFAGMKAFGS